MITDDVKIRLSREQDLPGLRRLVADTAYFGGPCEHFFPDREFLADLIMEYYIRYEPEHTWVAEFKGEVAGYLSAGFDEGKYSRYMLSNIVPKSLWGALRRGKVWSRHSGRLVFYNLWAALTGQARLSAADKKKYPVHIHQNVKEGLRGRKIGSRLVEAFLEFADRKKAGVRFRALRQQESFPFFERYGFRRHDCRRVPVWERWLGKQPLYFMEYVREAV
ncbi:MAG: GNAT family N-acetyltransferase [Candidatus Omnitrophota bacterium]